MWLPFASFAFRATGHWIFTKEVTIRLVKQLAIEVDYLHRDSGIDQLVHREMRVTPSGSYQSRSARDFRVRTNR